MNIVFQKGDLTIDELYEFIKRTDNQFSPSLSSRVNLQKYSEKLVMNSTIIYAKEKNKIIGLLAFYANDFKPDFAFITLICVLKEYEGNGIGTRLMNNCISLVKEKGFRLIKLEADTDTENIISFYTKNGFQIEKQNQRSCTMLKQIY